MFKMSLLFTLALAAEAKLVQPRTKYEIEVRNYEMARGEDAVNFFVAPALLLLLWGTQSNHSSYCLTDSDGQVAAS